METQPQSPQETQTESLQIQKTSNTKLLVIVAVLLFALVILVSVFGSVLLFSKKDDAAILPPVTPGTTGTDQNTKKEESVFKKELPLANESTGSQESTDQGVPALPASGDFPGYVSKDTLCYSLAIPQNHNAGEDNSCLQYISTNQAYPFSVNITLSVVQDDATPKQMADKFIANTLKSSPTGTFAQEAIKLGGVDAIKVIEGNAVNLVKAVHIFVLAPKAYNVSGYTVRNFELLTVQDGYLEQELQAGQQKDLATLIASWQWK